MPSLGPKLPVVVPRDLVPMGLIGVAHGFRELLASEARLFGAGLWPPGDLVVVSQPKALRGLDCETIREEVLSAAADFRIRNPQ